MFRAAGERILLCQLDVADAPRGVGDDLAENLSRLYHEGIDGIVFADADGNIRAANEAFLNLTDAASMSAVRGRSMADFLVRGAVDLRMMLDTVRRSGTMRMYATRLTTDFSGQVAVEIAANATAVQAGPPKMLFSTLGSTPVYEVTPDGQRFLVAEPEKNSEPPFTVLLNWQAGLKK